MNTKKEVYFLLALFLIAFLSRFALSYLSPVKYWDETIYVNLGRNIVLYGEYSFLHGFSDFSSLWPLASFRPPLLPLVISFISLFSFSFFLLNIIIPFLSSLGIIGIYFLCKNLFGSEVGVFSSIIFAFFPLNLFWGSKILTDTLFLTFVIFSVYFFFLTFFSQRKYSAIFFGISSGLAFLSRYSLIWFFPLFFLFLLYKKRLGFLLEKKIWISALGFFIIVFPWFLYNYFIYGSILGFLIHASEASLRWGGQPFSFYFLPLIKTFAILIPFFVIGLFCKRTRKERDYKIFFLLWFVIILLFLCFQAHKEVRYILPLLPVFAIFSGLGLNCIKKYRKIIFVLLILLFLVFNFGFYTFSLSRLWSGQSWCWLETMDFLKDSEADYVVTEHFSPVYYYSLKENIRVDSYPIIRKIIDENYNQSIVYYHYIDGDWFNLTAFTPNLIYECGEQNIFDISSN